MRAAKVVPGNPHVTDTLGWAHLHCGNLEAAVEILDRTAAAQPRNPTVHYHLAAALRAQGKLPDAKRHLESALALARTFPELGRARQMLSAVRERLEPEQ